MYSDKKQLKWVSYERLLSRRNIDQVRKHDESKLWNPEKKGSNYDYKGKSVSLKFNPALNMW